MCYETKLNKTKMIEIIKKTAISQEGLPFEDNQTIYQLLIQDPKSLKNEKNSINNDIVSEL